MDVDRRVRIKIVWHRDGRLELELDLGPALTDPAVAANAHLGLLLAHGACLESGLDPRDDVRGSRVAVLSPDEALRVGIHFVTHHVEAHNRMVLLQTFGKNVELTLPETIVR